MRRSLSIQIVRTAGCAWLALAFPLAFPLAAPARDAELAPGKTSSRLAEAKGRYAEMDHGPFFSGTIDTLFPERESYANKGIVVRLRRDPPAALCFDTELLKVSAAWTGGFLGWPHERDGIEGEPFPVGDLKFGTKPESLGWAKGDDFGDPRRIPYGPLPRHWARYRGLYRHGERVILSYTVGDGAVVETPALENAGGVEVFTRTLEIGNHEHALTMLVCEAGGAARKMGETAVVETAESVTAVGLVAAPRGCALRETSASLVPLMVTVTSWEAVPSNDTAVKLSVNVPPAPSDWIAAWALLAV